MLPTLRSTRRPGAAYLAGAPLLIAHRGGSLLAPENTLLAFQRALDWWNADILELDVQPSREGVAVVFHDATLDRTTDGAGPIAERSLDELRRLDAGYRFVDEAGAFPFRGTGVGISTLEEVLTALPTARINIEIKDSRAQRSVLEAISRTHAEHRVLVAAGVRRNRSLFHDFSGATSAAGSELRAFYIASRVGLTSRLRAKVDALQMPERYGGKQVLSPRLIRDAHARNLAVHVWTVDEEDDMHRLLDWGADGIITDRPDRLARVLHERIGRPLPPGAATG